MPSLTQNTNNINVNIMRKSFRIFAALSVVAVVLSGCITSTVLRTKWAVDEKNEIVSGKVFQETTGSVFYSYDGYSEGMSLKFKESGKYLRVDRPNTGYFLIITPQKVYQGNTKDKTYVEAENKDGVYYFSNLSMVFPTEWFRWEDFAEYMLTDETNKSEGTEYYADKKCTTFTSDEKKVGGYKRVYMYKEDRGKVIFRATRWAQGCDAQFAPPAECKKVSGSIDYEEAF